MLIFWRDRDGRGILGIESRANDVEMKRYLPDWLLSWLRGTRVWRFLGGIKERLYRRISESYRRHSLVGPARLWRMKRSFQIEALKRLGLDEDDTFLDVGCGTLRGGLPVVEYLRQGGYFGFDVRPVTVLEAKREVEDHNLSWKRPHLVVADVNAIPLSLSFDVVWAFSLVFHLSDVKLARLLEYCGESLAADGCMFFNATIGSRAEYSWEEFPFIIRPLAKYAAVARRHNLVISDLGSLEAWGHDSGRVGHDSQRLIQAKRANKSDRN